MPFTLDQLPQEDQAEVKAQRPELFEAPQPPAQPQGQSPVDLLTNPTDLADFLRDSKSNGGFTLDQWLTDPANRDRYERDAALKDRISEAQLIQDEERYGAALEKVVGKPGEHGKAALHNLWATPWAVLKTGGKMGYGLAKHAASAVMGFPQLVAAEAAGAVGAISPEMHNAWLNEIARDQEERMAGTISAGRGLFDQGAGAIRLSKDLAQRGVENAQIAKETDPEKRRQLQQQVFEARKERTRQALEARAGDIQAQQKISQGQDLVQQTLTGPEKLPALPGGEQLSQEKVATYGEGDPVSFMAFMGGFGALNKLGRVIASASTRAALMAKLAEMGVTAEKLAQAEKMLGDVSLADLPEAKGMIEGYRKVLTEQAGEAGALAGKAQIMTPGRRMAEVLGLGEVVDKIPKIAGAIERPIAAAGTAMKGAGLATAAAGVGVAAGAVELPMTVARALTPGVIGGNWPVVNGLIKFAENTRKTAFERAGAFAPSAAGGAGYEALGPTSRAAFDLIGGAPVKGAIEGFLTMDLPFTLATAETQEQLENPMLMGSFFGLAKGGKGLLQKFTRGQLIDATRRYGDSAPRYAPYNEKFTPDSLDAMTDRMVRTEGADPDAHQRQVNSMMATRQLVEAFSGGKTQVHWADQANYERLLADAGENVEALKDTQGVRLTLSNGQDVVLFKNPKEGPHESTHVLQQVLGEKAMSALYGQIQGIYGNAWDALGTRLARQMAQTPEIGEAWQSSLLKTLGYPVDGMTPEQINTTANRRLASEIHAEILDTVLKHDGQKLIEAGKDSPYFSRARILGDTARLLQGLSLATGEDPFVGTRSAVQRVPMTSEGVEVVRRHAQEALGRAERGPEVVVKVKPGATPPGPTGAAGGPTVRVPEKGPTPPVPESAQAKIDSMPEGPAKEGAQAAKNAIEGQEDLKLVYRHKAGTPAAEVESDRVTRRSEIAAGTNQVAVEEVLTPIRMMTDKGTPQILVLRRAVLDANTAKLRYWLDALDAHKRAEVERQYPVLAVLGDAAKMDALWEKAAHNARLGRTLAGEEFGKSFAEPGYWAPETKPGAAKPLDQRTADVLNYLFGIPIAGTPTKAPRVVLKGRVPVDVAAQRLHVATKDRLGPEVRPAYEGAGAEREGVAGIALREVNPFRGLVEATGKAPSLIEAFHRLNVSDILSVEPATAAGARLSGVEAFPRQAGYQAPKVPEKEYLRSAAIKDVETGRLRTGSMHPWIRDEIMAELLRAKLPPGARPEEILDAPIYTLDAKAKALRREVYQMAAESPRFEEGFYTSEGRFVGRQEALKIAREQEQLRRPVEGREWLDSDDLNVEAGFQAPGYIGTVLEDGIKAQAVLHLGNFRHEKLGMSRGIQWRFNRFSNTIYWSPPPSEVPKSVREDVRAWLAKRGFQNPEESFVFTEAGGRNEAADRAAHGEYQAPTAKEVADMPMEEFSKLTGYTSEAKHKTSGYTGLAFDVGLGTRTREGLKELSEAMQANRAEFNRVMDEIRAGKLDPAVGFDAAQESSNKAQFFREALEAATGTGSAGEYLRSKGYRNEDFPLINENTKAAFQGSGFLGSVDDDGAAHMTKVRDLARATHSSENMVFGNAAFRYRNDNKTLYWWGPPSEVTDAHKTAVLDLLKKQGAVPEEQTYIRRNANYDEWWAVINEEAYQESHGQRTPPEVRKQETRREKLQRAIDEGIPQDTLAPAFQPPPKDKDYPVRAAIRVGDKIIEAPTHEWAKQEAERRLGETLKPEDYELGFRLKSGKFASRVESRKLAEAAGQLDLEKLPFGVSRAMDSWEFGASRKFQAPTYAEASKQEGNPLVRPEEVKDGKGRVLLLQFSSNLLTAGGKEAPEAVEYYNKLYGGTRPGYKRMDDFWEIPQWMGFASGFLPNADVYVVRDMAEARRFLKDANYDRIAASSLDLNTPYIKELARDGIKLDVGGYAGKENFTDEPNIKWHDSMEAFAKDLGVPYKQQVDYRHFKGAGSIPRLTLSQGCKHKCAFCTVPKRIEETPKAVVEQQVDDIAKLGEELVYLNDKTFGQAENSQTLPDLSERMKKANPNFRGFVVQTTASQMTRFDPEWLKRSGIKFVELGVETYNDPILHELKKPATERVIDKATDALRQAGIALIPNIIIGFPGETADTYQRTLDWLKANEDIISHANIYNLAIYKDAELGKKIVGLAESDFNENVMEKSFHADPEVHRVFAGKLYGLAEEMLGGKPPSAQFQPKPLEEGMSGRIEEMKELWAPERRDVQFQGPGEERKLQSFPQRTKTDEQVQKTLDNYKDIEIRIDDILAGRIEDPLPGNDWEAELEKVRGIRHKLESVQERRAQSRELWRERKTLRGGPIEPGEEGQFQPRGKEITDDDFPWMRGRPRQGFTMAEYEAKQKAIKARKKVVAPERREDKWVMKPATPDSKAWILPDGTPDMLGGVWHDARLRQIASKWGVKIPKNDDDARQNALMKGFVRVNYGQSGGRMSVELRATDLRAQRAAIESLISANLDNIDNLYVGLFNRDASKVVDMDERRLFHLEGQEKESEAMDLLDNLRVGSYQPPKGEEEGGLFGYIPPTPGRFVSGRTLKTLSRREKRDLYPEAIIPEDPKERIEADILGSPRFKKAGSEEAAVKEFSDLLVKDARGWAKSHPEVWELGKTWYRRTAPLLRKHFGDDSNLFAQLLAATSPRTQAGVNFDYALDAFDNLKAGKFEDQITKYKEGMDMVNDGRWQDWLKTNAPKGPETPARFVAEWVEKFDLKPKSTSGALYGTHSIPVLQVFSNIWLAENRGPKTLNFVENLLGIGHDATIDIWAIRTMRRLGYEGLKPRWRILPGNETGVSDADFAFSQRVFERAAKKLGIKADDLQGAMWFGEKQHWANKGWGRLDLGDWGTMLGDVEGRRKVLRQRGPGDELDLDE